MARVYYSQINRDNPSIDSSSEVRTLEELEGVAIFNLIVQLSVLGSLPLCWLELPAFLTPVTGHILPNLVLQEFTKLVEEITTHELLILQTLGMQVVYVREGRLGGVH